LLAELGLGVGRGGGHHGPDLQDPDRGGEPAEPGRGAEERGREHRVKVGGARSRSNGRRTGEGHSEGGGA
jgi:hypothetical protein